MLVDKKHFAVNWQDGMKLSRQHFEATDRHVEELVRDATALFLKTYSYGLLPPVHGTRDFSEIMLADTANNGFRVEVKRCNAVTAGGYRIAYNPDLNDRQELRLSAPVPSHEGRPEAERPVYYVVLRVNVFQRVPFGAITESPPRQPFSTASYQLDVVTTTDFKSADLGPDALIIAQLLPTRDAYRIDTDFIPPATSMSSHPRLLRYKDDFEQELHTLIRHSRTIVRNVNSTPQPTAIARNVRELSVSILDFLIQVMFNFRNLDGQHPPVHLLDYFNNLASILQTALDCLPEREKDDLLAYFTEWSAVPPQEFEDTLHQLVWLDYRHHNIGASMQKAARFLQVMNGLWDTLSKRNFVGERKANFVVQDATRPLGAPLAPGRRWGSANN